MKNKTDNWEEGFNHKWKELGLHVGYANDKDKQIKMFIQSTLNKRTQEIRKSIKEPHQFMRDEGFDDDDCISMGTLQETLESYKQDLLNNPLLKIKEEL